MVWLEFIEQTNAQGGRCGWRCYGWCLQGDFREGANFLFDFFKVTILGIKDIVPQEDAKGKGGDLEMKANADDVPPSKLKIAAPSEPEKKVDAKEEKVDAKEEEVDFKTGGKEEKGESTITVSSLPGKEEKAANGEKDN